MTSRGVREVMGSIRIGDSDFFELFVPSPCHVDQFTFHRYIHSYMLYLVNNYFRALWRKREHGNVSPCVSFSHSIKRGLVQSFTQTPLKYSAKILPKGIDMIG